MPSAGSHGRYRTVRDRVTRCGSKGGSSSSYDPQVGKAAEQSAANAKQALDFNENYFTTTVKPMLDAETAQAATTTNDDNQLFGLNMAQAQKAADQDNTYGIPARSAYYNMVKNYSAPQEQESQAQAAIGDMRTAEASNSATLARQQQSLGIDPTSGSSRALASDASIQNTAAEAAAATRARYNAKQMGMTLTGDAASFSNTGVSNLTSLSGTAGGAAGGALGATATGLQGANSGAAVPNSGFALANSAYGNNLDAYSRMAAADIPVQAQASSGFGQFLGAGLSAALSFSDRRLKKNIERIGTWRHDLPLYRFEYIWGGGMQLGVMADDVEMVMPDAVAIHATGFKVVDYAKLR